jgi:hypothetical protein
MSRLVVETVTDRLAYAYGAFFAEPIESPEPQIR